MLTNLETPSRNVQMFDLPGISFINAGNIEFNLKSVDSQITLGKSSLISKYVSQQFYTTAESIDLTTYNDLRPSIESKSDGNISIGRLIKGIAFGVDRGLLEKPVSKLVSTEEQELVYKGKLDIVPKSKVFSLDQTLSWGTPRLLDLRPVAFDSTTAKLNQTTTIAYSVDLEEKPFGIFRSINKVAVPLAKFDDTTTIKYSVREMTEPIDTGLTVAKNGLIIRISSKTSGELHDPSTRRTVPVQFWN